MGISLVQHRALFTQALVARFTDDKAPNMGLAAFFPTVTTRTKYLSIEVERMNQLIAVDVMRCTDPNRNTFNKSTEKVFEPPYFNESFDFTACEGYNVSFGAGMAPNGAIVDNMLGESNRYITALKRKIQRAIEKQRADVLQSGIVTIKNGDSIDYRRKAASMVTKTGANAWDQTSTATPLVDLAAGANFLRKSGLSSGNVMNVIMGETAMANFLKFDAVYKERQIFSNFRRADIGMPILNEVTGLTLYGRVAAGDFILDLWTYSDFYTDAQGVQQPYIAPNAVIMIPGDFVGKTGYAGIPTYFEEDGAKSIVPIEAEFLVFDIVDQQKASWDFFVRSAPLVIPVSVDRIYTLFV